MSTQAVGSTNTATNSTSTSGTSGTNALSQNDFMQLLMTQLKNQNPLESYGLKPDGYRDVRAHFDLRRSQAWPPTSANSRATMQAGAVGQWTSSIGDYMQVNSTSVSQGESVTLSPTGSYDSLTLTLKDSSGTTSTKTFTSTQTPVYNDITGSYTIVGATQTKNGVSTSCNYAVNRAVSQGDEVVLSPSGNYDSLTLTLKDSSGNQTTQTFASESVACI